ncbi:toprim domain-containing protein [archaeon]|nr:toprim domain-containing protein [archaeon]
MNEKIQKLLTDLQHEMSEGIPVIVEGKNDKKALKCAGLNGKIHTLSSTSMHELAEKISRTNSQVIILTDLDDFGETAAQKLKDLFLNEAVKTDLTYRKKFKHIIGVRCFEDMPTLLEQEKNQ